MFTSQEGFSVEGYKQWWVEWLPQTLKFLSWWLSLWRFWRWWDDGDEDDDDETKTYPEAAIAWMPAGLIWKRIWTRHISKTGTSNPPYTKHQNPHLLQVGNGLSLDGSSHFSSSKGVQLVPMKVYPKPSRLSCLNKGGSIRPCLRINALWQKEYQQYRLYLMILPLRYYTTKNISYL